MIFAPRLAAAALLLLPFLSHAQGAPMGAVGLEIPSPAPPSRGHFLTGAYVSNSFAALPSARAGYGYGYAVQPYLRYQLGSSKDGFARPFVQYSFAPYLLPAYGPAAGLAPSGGLPGNLEFAPLPLRSSLYGSGYGGLGAFSVGVPFRMGGGSATLHVAGSVLGSLVR